MNKDADQKKPGEKAPGKFHFNPGNMSGKSVKLGKVQSEVKQADEKQNADNNQPETKI